MSAKTDSHNPPYMEYSSHEGDLKIFGFWIFLGAEIALFATLFASYLVYQGQTAGGPTAAELFVVKDFVIMTFLLLTSSFTCGLAVHQMRLMNKKGFFFWIGLTLLLGAGFLYLEINEFIHYAHEGATIQTSAFLSAFFLLVGTHGAHVTVGICWILLLLLQVAKRGFTPMTTRKIFITGLYWHFLDVVWIFVFTVVYLMGVMS
ncbi:cytochrome aa3 quinol oxidase subunit III [Risungbinella massiliensis]|uniref:cytochrome aa3 quinol oxidase subunit III n=1 Tax=Risungbinella massiliensis TaxID=1329796 RepID=UPI0005CC6E88|nr:cytochrome aa3 quinol oxidase subunit III [Risungbinella massiliensis]